jgi:fucose 4-O-acetylase-like acetyltransferase
MRVRSRGSAEAVTGHVDRGHFARVAMAFSALAYPMAAWLALAHVAPPAGEVAQSQSHLGHGSVATLTVLFPLVLAITLAVTLTVLFVGALRRRRVLIALETGAMAVMIVAMVAMLILPH